MIIRESDQFIVLSRKVGPITWGRGWSVDYNLLANATGGWQEYVADKGNISRI